MNKIINADDFSIIFMRMFEKIGAKVYQLKIDLKKNSFQSSGISKLLVKGKAYRYGIGDLLARISGDYDSFNPNPSSRTDIQLDEEELRNCAKMTFFEIESILANKRTNYNENFD